MDFRRASASQLADLLREVRHRTLQMFRSTFSSLHPKYAVPESPTLNPLLWELGHVGWFQSWWIARNTQRNKGHLADPAASRLPPPLALADAWYDSSAMPHGQRWSLKLPGLEQTEQMLSDGLEETLTLLDQCEQTDNSLYFFRWAYAHEAMHAEAFCMMANTLGLRGASASDARSSSVQLPQRVSTSLRVHPTTLSALHEGQGFSFDNELGGHADVVSEYFIDSAVVNVDMFASYLVANGRHDEARLARLRPGEAPATHVSFQDAQSCAAWLGRRLPSEHEWRAAALQGGDAFCWGAVWEWTASPFIPFTGFLPHPYRDYSAPWFHTHQVLKGGSEWTEPAMKHIDYRNFYLSHRQDMLCGFRTVGEKKF